ncbi:YhgE/Pip domain-containing protein [Bacillus canaveralius]|uniref:YhgE/Pip domain-containing protein n=2 Tax=Bacillus canaveralius TaxID=1403243 RepID=A0A2N5GS69_9BACI|nr:YhgE/Pip domain-containing protein [Bacillus canaveralius]PLR98626.1 YhgE/Pip domain-containing protein [Bacillus canaveralius]
MINTKVNASSFILCTKPYLEVLWMNVFNLLSVEFAKLAANKALLFSIIAALLVPVAYGGILLSADWGPYDNLSNLPVAVVNNDKGAMSEDEPINVGRELVANLKKGKQLGWKFVDSAKAMKGLQNNDFYIVIVIPEDFSQRVTTVLDPNPKKLELEYIQNEGLNFLASQVTRTATERIREQLANTITEQYVTSVMGEVADGFEKAADGSAQLADGTTQLHDGTTELQQSVTEKSPDIARLADGANQLKGGTGQLVNSLSSKQADITKLANGTKELKNGTSRLLKGLHDKSGDISRLSNGAKELHNGMVSLKGGTSQILAGLQRAEAGSTKLRAGIEGRLVPGSAKVTDGAVRLADGAVQLEAGIKEYQNFNVTTKLDPNYQKIVEGAEKILAGAISVRDGSTQISNGLASTAAPGAVDLNEGIKKLLAGQIQVDDGAAKLEAGAKQIADGNAAVNNGWSELTNGVTALDKGAGQISDGNAKVDEGWKALTTGASKINNGMGQVSNGTTSVNEGWGKLADGTTKLNDGAGKVNDGTQQLASGLKDGAEKTGRLKTGEENAGMFAAPVELVSDKINGYEYYRDSTAPYILTLGLFSGILIMSMFIDFKRPPFVSSVRWFAVKFMHLGSLAIVQAILLLSVVLLGLKLHVTNPIGLIVFALIASVTFSAIVLFLAAFGGNIGRFIALVFIILQLSITGANLPIDMLPETYRNVSAYLPFTYSIAGFKSVISLNSFGSALVNAGMLLIFLVIFGLLSWVAIFIKKKYQQQDSDMAAETVV